MTTLPTDNITNKNERWADYSARLNALFAGGPWHGTYRPEPTPLPGVKVEIRSTAKTLPGRADPELWRLHLAGEQPLGVVPIRDDDTCLWACIDVDSYIDLDHAATVKRLKREKLPLLVCKSKSNGMHIFAFLKEPVSAADVRRKMREIATGLGYPADTEIFPKHDTAVGDGENTSHKHSAWLNMPYFDSEETTRYAVMDNGLDMHLREFLDLAERSRLSPDDFMALRMSSPAKAEDRNAGRGAAPSADEFDRLLAGWLRKLSEAIPGKADDTLMQIARDIGRWASAITIDYQAVQDQVIEAWYARGKNDADFHAQYHRCVDDGRKKGDPPRLADGGGGDRFPDIDKIVVLVGGEEDEWRLTLRGWGDIVLPVRDVMHYYTFNVRCAARLGAIFDQLKQDTWYERLREARAQATFEKIPETETPEYEMRELLRKFLTDKHKAEEIDEVLLGKPYLDENEGRRYFRFGDFQKFLLREDSSFGKMKPNIAGRWVRRAIGTENLVETKKTIKGVAIKLYHVPAELFDATPELSLPKLEKPPI
ncbi:hypothetical protein G6L15_09505 [Agrobacterium rhizogenes]|uniref:TOTE conflict system archaeo-eukaryotic primase domain-containing protein n=1 Tax=Rhizobium rhizogenes TaxID=359 RepID=UPI0015744BED|nr:hypothetical protein [Rhizobium rhizogenes]NTG86374.1 hypothetical protein [Rhizobium rhizogenes]